MIPDTISDIFQPMNDFCYGLDVEMRPKLAPGAGTPRWALAAIHPGWGNRYLFGTRLLGIDLWLGRCQVHRVWFGSPKYWKPSSSS